MSDRIDLDAILAEIEADPKFDFGDDPGSPPEWNGNTAKCGDPNCPCAASSKRL